MRVSTLYKLQQRAGFSLIELLATGVIIISVGLFGFITYSVVSNNEIFNESQIKTVNLTQKIMEAAEAQASLNFDTLQTSLPGALFDADGILFTPCPGTTITSGEFAGYTPCIAVNPTSSSQVKQVDLSVSSGSSGENSIYYSFLVTRPPADLPGDITGTVTDPNTGAPIQGAEVMVCSSTNSNQCFTAVTGANGVFTFADPITGAFTLQPGEWIISVTQTNYEPYPVKGTTVTVEVFSGQQTTFNIQPTPDPKPAQIIVDAQNQDTGEELNSFVALLQKGSPSIVSNQSYAWTTPATFTVTFNVSSPPQQCFTVATGWYGSWFPFAYATAPEDAPLNSLPPVLQPPPGYQNPNLPPKYHSTPPFVPLYDLGYSQDDACGSSYGTPNEYTGWSSAVFTNNGLQCSNSYYGPPDNVCVNPGQTLHVTTKLVPNPTATLQGTITYNDQTTPETAATVTVFWGPLTPSYDAQGSAGVAYTTVDANGHYSVTIPAAQELFPNSEGYWMGIVACGLGYNETFTPFRWEMLCSPAYNIASPPWTIYDNSQMQDMSIGPAFTGNVITKNVEIDDVGPILPGPPPIGCWTIAGQVVDATTGAPIQGATVSLPDYEKTYTTDSNGDYSDCISSFDSTNGISCVGNKCPTSPWSVTDTNGAGYYPYVSSEEAWYTQQTTCSSINNDPSTNTGFNFPTIYLLPAETGVIKVMVEDAGGEPFGNLLVNLNQVDGTILSGTSDPVTGEVDFPNALTSPANAPVYDSWPDGAFPGEVNQSLLGYFNQSSIDLSISVPPPNSNYNAAGASNIVLNSADSPLTVIIKLTKKPGA